MGKRLLAVDPQFLIETLKRGDGLRRSFTVEHPLPDDTRYVGYEWIRDEVISLVLESEEWMGDSRMPIEPPQTTMHFDKADDITLTTAYYPTEWHLREEP